MNSMQSARASAFGDREARALPMEREKGAGTRPPSLTMTRASRVRDRGGASAREAMTGEGVRMRDRGSSAMTATTACSFRRMRVLQIHDRRVEAADRLLLGEACETTLEVCGVLPPADQWEVRPYVLSGR
jgi:hypothetical protein